MELFKALTDFEQNEADYLYDKLVNDLSQVNAKYHDWWKKISSKYQWGNDESMQWEVEFDTCTVYLKKVSK